MFTRNTLHYLTLSLAVAVSGGCGDGIDTEDVGEKQSAITEVAHTTVERQSIGNCWLYAAASWVESINKAYRDFHQGGGQTEHQCAHLFCDLGAKLNVGCMPTGTEHATCLAKICEEDSYCCETEWDAACVKHVEDGGKCSPSLCAAPTGGGNVEVGELDVSQSYWTYWHWFDQVTGHMWDDEISTGGSTWVSNGIMRDRGLMNEVDFVPADAQATDSYSNMQSRALSTINAALTSGELSTDEARQNGELVRRVFDDAWGLSPEVRQQLNTAFGTDGAMTLRSGGTVDGTKIIDAAQLPVRYATRNGDTIQYQDKNLVEAIRDWSTIQYPGDDTPRRQQLVRVQRALHARQPVGVTWNVDFNALENSSNNRRGSFNLQTLKDAGRPGHQGGHMTVLHDYEALTPSGDPLKAGVLVEDPQTLEAALSYEITLLRTKNSWGAAREDRSFVDGYPGYHDLWMDYLNGPLNWCPDEDNPTYENCRDEQPGLRAFLMPPGF